MTTKLSGGFICDPTQGSFPNEPQDLFCGDDGIISSPPPGTHVDSEYKLTNHVVMAGGIDLHTHIGGGKVNLARLLLPELYRRPLSYERESSQDANGLRDCSRPLTGPVPGTWETGRRYLEMGYTACFEPAVLPANARQAHLEMEDTPYLDTGGYLMLGNEELLLQWIHEGVPQAQITDYVGWMLKAHRCIAVKVVNAGGISAFKFNQRELDVDSEHARYKITPRAILSTLSQAVEDLGLAHPLHVHCSNLGVPGNIDSTMATIQAVEGRRLHVTHAQFHCYGKSGPHGFSSEASTLATCVNTNPQLTIDVGQVLFGQTVTISGDTMHQFENRSFARPRKVIFQDLECQAGCGVVPFRYRQSQYVHGLQWAIGLELFLLIENPWQVYLTTDHPNGAPFCAYPHLIRLLMDYEFRMSIFEQLHSDVRATSRLPSLKRQYTLDEIVVMTRSGPARALGLEQLGHLRPGASGDIVVYRQDSNPTTMFSRPEMVFRNGILVYRQGEFLGVSRKKTYVAAPHFDRAIERHLRESWNQFYLQSMESSVL